MKPRNLILQLSLKPDFEKFTNVIMGRRTFESRGKTFKDLTTATTRSSRNGNFGKTAQFWIGYIDLIWLILTFIKATKENNFHLHLATLYELCAMFFAYNHHNYSRHIPAYLVQ